MTIPLVAQRFGHRGVALLRIAVLDVLYQARKANECLGCAGISRRAGIFREPGYARKRGNDDIVMVVLGSLVKSELLNKCTQKNGNPGWQLTDATFTRRDEEITTVSDWGGDNWIISAYRTRQWGFVPPVHRSCRSVRMSITSRAKATGGSDDAENKQALRPIMWARSPTREETAIDSTLVQKVHTGLDIVIDNNAC